MCIIAPPNRLGVENAHVAGHDNQRKEDNMARYNVFANVRSFNDGVVNYIWYEANKQAVRQHYGDLLKEAEATLKSWENLRGSALARTQEQIDAQVALIEQIKKQRDEDLEKYVYEKTEHDKLLVKTAKSASSEVEVAAAIMKWMRQAGNDKFDDAEFCYHVIHKCGDKKDWKRFHKTTGAKCTRFDTSKLVFMCYAAVYEKIVQAGIVKAVDVPVWMKEHYAIEAAKAAKKSKAVK